MVVLVFAMIAGTVVYGGESESLHLIRVTIMLALILCYEPVLTSKLCTVGQLVVGIRVRQLHDRNQRISLWRAILRTSVKVLLGWYSFFTMWFQRQRRAVHDYAAGSVVVEASYTREIR